MKWLEGWNGNPFVKPKEGLPDLTRKSPDVLEILGKRRWVTTEEAEWHYISTRLGHMEKEGFKFLYPGSPFEWPEDYLNSVLAHNLSLQVLREKQEFETSKGPGIKKIEVPEHVKAANLARSKGMYAAFSER